MADLTGRLPLTDGTNRVYDGVQGPSLLGTVADFIGDAFEGGLQIRKDLAAANQRKKQKEKDAAEAEIAYRVSGAGHRAEEAAARSNQVSIDADAYQESLRPIHNTETPLTLPQVGEDGTVAAAPPVAVEQEVRQVVGRAQDFWTAIQQKKLPPISAEAALNADFRALREQYPEHLEYIIDMYSKFGLKDSLFTGLQEARAERIFQREQEQKTIDGRREFGEKAIELAKTAMGPDALGMKDEDLMVHGMRLMKSKYTLDVATEEANLKKAQAEANSLNRKEAEEDLNKGIEREIFNIGFNDAAALLKKHMSLTNVMLKDPNNPKNIQEWQALGVKMNALAEQSVMSSVQLAARHGYTGDPDKLAATLRQKYKPILDLFQGDFSVAKVSIDAFNSITAMGKLDMQEALPLFSALQDAGLKPENMPGFMKGVETNSKLQKQLQDEMKGFSQDWKEDRASTRLINIIRILKGETNLQDHSPPQQRAIIASLQPTVNAYAKDYNANKLSDPSALINGAAELAMASRSINPSSDTNVMLVASKGFASLDVRNALIKAVNDPNSDKQMLLPTLQVVRAANANILDSIRVRAGAVNKNSRYFQMVWDDKNAKWRIDDTKHKNALAMARRGAPSLRGAGAGLEPQLAVSRLSGMKASQEMRDLVRVANENLDSAIDIGRVDPSTPKATDLELRRFYGQDTPLPNKGGEKPVNIEQETTKMFKNLEKEIEQRLESVTKPSTLPASTSYQNNKNYQALAPAISATAAKYGIPEDIAISLIGKESSFVPGKDGPLIEKGVHKGDRAKGLGQVMAKTAAAYGVTDRSKLTPEEELDLSFRILSDNYKSSGNWKDAVSMYFTGVSYEKAKAQGRTDGFNNVIQYVESIL